MAGGLTSLLGTGFEGRDNTAAVETNTIIVFDIMNVVGLLMTTLVLLPALLSPMASLVYGAPVLVSFAGWAYVLQLYFGLAMNISTNKMYLLRINIMLLVTPVVMACIMFIVSLAVGAQSPNTVTIDSTRRYCHITSHVPRTTAAILIGLGTAGMMVFEVLLSMHLSRNWVTLKKVTDGEISIFAWYKFGRIIIFTIFPFGAFALNIGGLFSSGTTNDKWNILLPIIPLGAAIIFGSRTDIIYAWKMSYKAEATWNIYEDPKPCVRSRSQ
ncbi:hypothetical protein LENED_012692 [Lentinula edodes]|uniref:Uncharacterized protein n=1 Tax=Lentinula edodes TaxID=5353 RepID=A0A1Q3ET91_LENED|nr:hypothetical protein LENED_012692 [Lentinula edodes]